MPFNGLGTFDLVYDWVQDRNNGIKIIASRMMGQEDDIAAGLSNCITADGQTTITNTIPLSNNQITLLASATTRLGAANLGQIVDGSAQFASASGTNAYVADLDPAVTTIPNGMTVKVYFPNTNTAAATAELNLNGTGSRPLVVGSGVNAPAGAIKAGMGIVVAYGSVWQYFGSIAPAGVFGLADGGLKTASFSAGGNTRYRCPVGGTITLPTPTGSGDTIVVAIYGSGTTFLSGIVNGVTSTTAFAAVGDQTLIITDADATRGWV